MDNNCNNLVIDLRVEQEDTLEVLIEQCRYRRTMDFQMMLMGTTLV